MQVSKKEGKILDEAITNWLETDVISESDSHKLKASYKVTSFDWKRVAKYSFWLAISCIVISISSVLADKWLIELFIKLFNTHRTQSNVLAFLFYHVGYISLALKEKFNIQSKFIAMKQSFFWVWLLRLFLLPS